MLESILVFLREEMVKPALGADTYRFLPLLWTYFFFIITCNLLGLIPFSATATGNISVTAGLAVIAFVTYHFFGMKRNGVVTYWKENLLVGPPFLWPLMIIIEVAGHVIKTGCTGGSTLRQHDGGTHPPGGGHDGHHCRNTRQFVDRWWNLARLSNKCSFVDVP